MKVLCFSLFFSVLLSSFSLLGSCQEPNESFEGSIEAPALEKLIGFCEEDPFQIRIVFANLYTLLYKNISELDKLKRENDRLKKLLDLASSKK